MKVIQNISILGLMVAGFSIGYADEGDPLPPTGFPICCTNIAQSNYPCKDPSGGTGSWSKAQCLTGCVNHCLPGNPPNFEDFAYLACKQGCNQY
ncbi:MAG: hypothetical protein WCI55_14120 [Armatimonadota bacterium]